MGTKTLPVKKKKRSVAVAEAPARKRISKLRTKGMRSIVGDAAEDIQQLLEIGENDSATSLMHKKLLQSLVDLLPYAEHNVRASKGTKGVYQVNSLVSSIRELVIDLQSTQDRGALGVNLVESVIRPAFLDIGMTIVQEYQALLNDVKDALEPEDYKRVKQSHKDSRQRLAEFIQAEFGKVRDQSVAFLQR